MRSKRSAASGGQGKGLHSDRKGLTPQGLGADARPLALTVSQGLLLQWRLAHGLE